MPKGVEPATPKVPKCSPYRNKKMESTTVNSQTVEIACFSVLAALLLGEDALLQLERILLLGAGALQLERIPPRQ